MNKSRFIGEQILFIIGIFFVVVLCLFFSGGQYAETAKFLVSCFTPIGVVSAVAVAIFGDYFKSKGNPLVVDIEPIYENTLNEAAPVPGTSNEDAICSHLKVINRTPHKPLENCRIWLKDVQRLKGGKFESDGFAVARIMNWAPHDWKPVERTISNEEVFDVGVTFARSGFYLHIDKNQGGNFTRRIGFDTTFRMTFYVTADNYHDCEYFTFEMKIPARPKDFKTEYKAPPINLMR